MAKNEAKIKFTAETGDFNKAIKQANDEMSELRAEFKLSETQMKRTGTTVEGLEKQHALLESQLKASQSKTEALTQKVEKAVEIFGENSTEVTKLKTQLANAQSAEEKIRQAIDRCNKELGEQVGAAKEAESATGQLTDKIDKQQTELDQLKKKYVDAVLQYGKTSKEAKTLAREIKDLSGDLRDSKSDFSKASKAADNLDKSLDDAGDAAAGTEDGFTIAKGAIADLASNAIQAAIGKISEFIGYLMELPEATREIRQDMATLETSFEKQGFSTETATKTWKELYTVFGEDDRAVEAANLISKMSKDQEDLNEWVTITKGVWGQYQDSLPVEGLAEASNETAKTGKVTGVLADALNWSGEAASMFSKYMSEDVTTAEDAFNEALADCTTEQERQALITETLTALYGDSAKKYEEASGAQIEAKDAAAENILVQNELADTMEPLTTSWQGLKTELLQGILPAAKKFSEWGVSALSWMKEHPTAMKVFAAVVGVLAVALGALVAVVTAYTIAQWAMNSAILANPITWIVVGIVAAIAALVAVFVLLWDKCEGFRNFFIDMWKKIKVVWAECKPYFDVICEGIKTAFSIAKDFLIAKFKAAWEGIKLAWSVAVDWFKTCWNNIKLVFSVVKVFLVGYFKTAWEGIKAVWNAVTGYFKAVWNTIKGIFSVVKAVLTGDFKGAWQGIKGIVSTWKNYFASVWKSIKNVFASVKSWFSSTFGAAWTAIKGIWSNVSAFFGRTVDKVKNTFSKVTSIITKPFKTAIDKVKGFFNNLKLKFPSIKLPHFKIKGSFSLNPPSVPKLSIDWYKKGGIFTKPTIFSTPSGFKGVGEAGAEAILPIDRLQGYIAGAIEKSSQVVNLQSLADAIEDLANRPVALNINGKQFALATASSTDSVSGMRSRFVDRGIILD